MDAQTAYNQLDPQAWANTSVIERLAMLEQVQNNMKIFAEELGSSDAKMKNEHIGEEIVSTAEGMAATIMAMGNTLTGIRHLYESLAHGEMPEPLSTTKIGNELYEIEVYPIFPQR